VEDVGEGVWAGAERGAVARTSAIEAVSRRVRVTKATLP
jgi:hypothetical protein